LLLMVLRENPRIGVVNQLLQPLTDAAAVRGMNIMTQTGKGEARRDSDIEFRWGVKIPLRDGVRLNATMYTPKWQSAPTPCIFTLTPYISDTYHERGVFFAKHGLPFVIVDVRGRGNSEGVFRPMIQEAKDGYDIVEWLAAQPYCNGKVAMWGGSYGGYVQWATAKEFPPHLVTIVPVAALCCGVDFPMRNNIFYPYVVQWLTLTSGRAYQIRIFSDNAFWSAIYRRWHESGRPFRDVDSVLGNPSPVFQEWLTHPEPDAFWDAHNPTAEEYGRLQIPILTITGSYDDDQPGALEHYREYMRHASPAVRAQHHLVIGPWDHAGTRTPQVQFGGLTFEPASLLDLPMLHLEWYAWVMQNGPKPEFLKKPVAYYVMGAERWQYADTLEAVTVRHQRYFLDSGSNATDIFSAGSLRATPGTGQPDTYRYDPRDTDGIEVTAEARTSGGSLVDQSVTLALCGKALVYHSEPFENDIEISGFFKLSAWISIDCPDTDLYVSVCEISLDGSSIRLSTDAIRARYREGRRTQKLIAAREPLRYDFDRFTFVSRQIERGHRLRLVVAPMGRLIETTFVEKNYNAGGIVAEESVKDGKPVIVRLFHDDAYQSVLYVPIGRSE
jgi:putative CocE/NonD family hydrolase